MVNFKLCRVPALIRSGPAISVIVAALATSGLSPVFAQDGRSPTASPQGVAATADEGSGTSVQNGADIIVTGTLVRGIVPPGANVLASTQADIEATGSTSVAQVLQTIPQLGSFQTLQQPLGVSNEVAVNRPNLRNLPNVNTGAGSTTLVLMDGHRMVGMGVTSNSPDPDVIPPGVIERLEIVPDGGSAIYGSDAVAGVLNFVTIKRFDGLKVDGSYGFADNYYAWDANATIGKDWGSGSIFLSYNYAKNDALLGKDRDYVRQFPGSNGRIELRCQPGNIEALAGVFAAAGSARGTNGGALNQCDNSDFATLYPAMERHSAFGGLTQQLSDRLSIDIRAYYTNRDTHIQGGPFRASEIIVPSFFAPTAAALGIPAITSPYSPFVFGGIVNGAPVFLPGSANSVDLVQQADFQIGANDAQHNDIELDTWGATSTFTYDLTHNFRLRVIGNYGQSTTTAVGTALNEPALQNAIKAGLFNPYDPTGSTTSPAATGIITNFENFGRTRQRLINFKAVVDGDLFELPAGAAKIAVGAEYINENFVSDRGQVVPGAEFGGAPAQFVGTTLIAPAQAGAKRFSVGRDVKSLFGEIVAPILGGDSGVSLTVSAAGRYDDYSDVGSTFNPRFGATFKPVDWISFRGAWGKSFNAPGLGDNENADFNTLFILSGSAASFFAPPAALVAAGKYPAYNGGLIVAFRGNAPGIKPQKATTWTAGFDIEPPIVPGLHLSATYYNISYKNFIGLADFQTPALLYRDFGNLITIAPSQAVLDAALANADIIAIGSPPIPASGTYAFFDARKRNLGDFKLDGIDFSVSYRKDTGFGSIFFNSGGTYELNRDRSNAPGAAFIDVVSANVNRFRARTTLGTEIGPVLAQASWNFSQGYDLDPPVGFVPQAHVKSYNTFDLFFKIDVPGDSVIARDLSFTLNVNNIFDQDPPVYRGGSAVGGSNGYQNGATLGRFVKFGVSKKF
ncbi:TonB-dependent receptor plug domain-containing protein [Sphingomonas tabacisoli]|uniref:TonB-dependent receptor plug domain-containing protein n=1 Tax=Sphingomonas tabacisoli TaxID=2249466 RepID=A0ABW4I3M6_9SPHN